MVHSPLRNGLLFALVTSALASGCVKQSDYDALQAQNKSLQQQNSTLSAQLASSQAHAGRLQGAIAYTINSDMLFKSGSWDMSPQGEKVIAGYAQKLAPMQQSKIMVSGYTDNQPVGRALQQKGVTSNDELSKKRADAVMQYLISQGVKPDMVAAQGFGEASPIAPNDTPQGRAQNRRVELSVASAEQTGPEQSGASSPSPSQ